MTKRKPRRKNSRSGTRPPVAPIAPGDEVAPDEESFCRATVAMVHKRACTVYYQERNWRCKVADSAFRDVDNYLVVGDRVLFVPDDSDATTGSVVYRVEPRKTTLVRMREERLRRSARGTEHLLAANIDVAVVVAATVRPPFRPQMVDRYLVMCQYGGIEPVICINKCDLAAPPPLQMYAQLDLPILFTSAHTGQGIDELREVFEGRTGVLCGHSGVGKSSLTNQLLGREAMDTRPVREADGRGRHTTTVSTLFKMENGGYLIDTPGIRSWGLWEVDAATLKFYFPDFLEVSDECRFRDCNHLSEPSCAVRDAVEEGRIPAARYQSYLRMLDDRL